MDRTGRPPDPAHARERRWHLVGWGLFVASALFFLAASWRVGDLLAIAGSLLFLVACFVFLAPFAWQRGDSP